MWPAKGGAEEGDDGAEGTLLEPRWAAAGDADEALRRPYDDLYECRRGLKLTQTVEQRTEDLQQLPPPPTASTTARNLGLTAQKVESWALRVILMLS